MSFLKKFYSSDKFDRFLIIFGVFAVLIIGLLNYKIDYYITSPGIALELEEIITVEDGAKDSEGGFYLTAVNSMQANFLYFLLMSLFHPRGFELTPKEDVLPENMDAETYLYLMEEMMTESKLSAQVVALKQMGFDVKFDGNGAEITEIADHSHAKGLLEPGDVIIGINGELVKTSSDAVSLIQKYPIGQVVNIEVKRGDEILNFDIKTIESKDNPGKASIGIFILTYYGEVSFPLDIDIKTHGIVGPSAGLMFTLEIIDQLHPRDLTTGFKIAGTGTIDYEGNVGPISGVTQKVIAAENIGAKYFLSPAENYEEAVQAAQKLTVVKVNNITDAMNFLLNL